MTYKIHLVHEGIKSQINIESKNFKIKTAINYNF